MDTSVTKRPQKGRAFQGGAAAALSRCPGDRRREALAARARAEARPGRHYVRGAGRGVGPARPVPPPPSSALAAAAAHGREQGDGMAAGTGAERLQDGSCHFQRSRLLWMIAIAFGMILLGVRRAPRRGSGAGRGGHGGCCQFQRANLFFFFLFFKWVTLGPSTIPYSYLGPFGTFLRYIAEHYHTWVCYA